MRTVFLLTALAATGCLNQLIPPHASPSNPNVPVTIDLPSIPDDVFFALKAPADAHAELCANDGSHPMFPNDADQITKAFCQDLVPGGSMPQPTGLADLLQLLGLDFKDPNGGNGTGGNPAFAVLGHSSALTARNVSALTPTAFVFTPPPTDGSKPSGYVFLAYDPGEQFVEVAAHDPVADAVNLYLVLFDKACKSAPGGCAWNDLLTPNLITGWSNVRIYESTTSLNDTVADCRQCHAPKDSGPTMLRMQENVAPFTHWFSNATSGGKSLLKDFHAAHGTAEDYVPIPAALMDKSDPAQFAQLVGQAGFATQPNAFDSAIIESQLAAVGSSVTWQAIYDHAVAGQFIAPPYHDVKVTDTAKLTNMTQIYQQWMGGKADLPDIRDVFLDEALRDLSFAPKAGLDGRGLLTQMCQQCHNANLDPTISRDKFLVDQLDQMTRAEKDVAITRLDPNEQTFKRMPPLLFHTITQAERDLMIAELQQ